MARQLFGTDGIRGVAGDFPLDARTVHAVGVALGRWAVGIHGPGSEILIGMDTRESGPWLASQVAGGIEEADARVRFAGLVTTPGVAYLTRSRDFVAGVMISASHNPYRDNGIKVFDHSGYKLPDEVEDALEEQIFSLLAGEIEPRPAALNVDAGLDNAYVDWLLSTFPHRLEGMKLVVDCANGAAVHLAPELFRRLGAEVVNIHCAPDGRNINFHCGALHMKSLQAKVLAVGAAAGIAFDGDADRALFVSASGKIVDGDAMLLLTAESLLRKGLLHDNEGQPTVVATVMSNYGLEGALQSQGIRLLRTAVGDKYVLEEMVRRGSPLGGEQSGHVIFHRYATTGDGMLTALRVLEVMRETGRDLDDLTAGLKILPQLLVNVHIKHKRPLDGLAGVQREIRAAMDDFDGEGRVLVRFSGTEPLARVMVEGPETGRVEHFAHRIARAVEIELGS
ncbi:MAG TPA: phosphoglucosamine mutase [Bryobacteraceae bacterium]|nr:phosphoglucosamine mutase [Bryobacteraceae bacterium]